MAREEVKRDRHEDDPVEFPVWTVDTGILPPRLVHLDMQEVRRPEINWIARFLRCPGSP